MQKWHESDEFKKLVWHFYENHARPVDKKEMSEAKQHCDLLLQDILQALGGIRIEYQGSSYEGIKTRSSDLEFDCMIVLSGGEDLSKDTEGVLVGFSKLYLKNKTSVLKKFAQNGYLLPGKLRPYIYGKLVKATKNSENIIVRKHGEAAAQLDIHRPGSQLWYSVDVVPGFEIGGECFIPKSSGRKKGGRFTWRRSFAKEEKELMSDLDEGNQCHKMCARMLKVICNIDSTLRGLQSYVIKTTVLNYDKQNPHMSWREEDFPARFLDLLGQLYKHLKAGHLSHYFIGGKLNVIGGIDPQRLENMALRIQSLLRKKAKLVKLLQM